jgi:hypothetical protein
LDVAIDLDDTQRRVLHSFAPLISAVVIEMACVVMLHEGVLSTLVVHAAKPRRIGDPFVADPEAMTAKSALHTDPQAFLLDAIERREAAILDVSRAKRRIAYLEAEREEEVVVRESPPPSAVDSAASLASISAIRGMTDDLLRAIEPPPRPVHDPVRRRR